MKKTSFVTAFLCGLLFSTSAQAVELYEFGFGLQGVAGYNWNNPKEGSLLPELGGLRLGYGVAVDFRLLGLVGIEANLIRSSDSGEATLEDSAKSFVSVRQDAWHVPVLLKVTLPLPLIRPLLMAGVNFVLPGSCSIEGLENVSTCKANDYSAWTAGLGGELDIPIPGIDIKIPASVRYSQLINRGVSSDASVIRSEWDHDLYATLGVSIYF